MKKVLLSLCCLLLLCACSSSKKGNVVENSKESTDNTDKVYDLNLEQFDNFTIKVYELVDHKWNNIDSKDYSNEEKEIHIVLHDSTSNDNTYSLQYYLDESDINNYDFKLSFEQYSYHDTAVSELDLEKSKEHVLALYEWYDNSTEVTSINDLSDLILEDEYGADAAYIVTITAN
jgi:hypothetical protein